MKKLSTQKGFSLIELMVVVGIIGILAAVAIPQFSKFQAKSRQTEAKVALASLFTAEKGFYAEWSSYTCDLKNAGFGMEGARARYDAGFPTGAATTGYPTTGGAPAEVVGNSKASVVSSIIYVTGAAPSAPATAIDATTNSTFTAVSYGDPNNTPAAAGIDVWSMTETKLLANPVVGIL